MNRSRSVVVVVTLAVVVALVVWLRPPDAPERGQSCGLPPAGVSAYALAWTSSTSVTTPTTRLEGQLDLAATLRLERVVAEDGTSVVLASLEDVTRHTLTALGADLATKPLLTGQVVQARLGADGRVEALGFQPETSEVTRTVLQWLLNETQVICPPTDVATWTTIEPSMLGDAVTAWEQHGRTHWSRTHTQFLSVRSLPQTLWSAVRPASSGELRFDEKGELLSLSTSDVLTIEGHGEISSRLSLTRTEQVPAARVVSQPFIARAPTEIVVAAETERKLLESRAAGMTAQQLVHDVELATTGLVEDHNRWLARAAAALALDPEGVRALAALSEGATGPQRALLIDLLVSAQTKDAKRALLSVLDAQPAREDPAYSMLVQRLALVVPDDEVAEFARQRFGETEGKTRVGFAYALGAIGRDAVGAAGLEVLRAAIDHAPSDEERGALLGALANAGDPQDVARILAGLEHPSVEVRRGAALAARSALADAVTVALVERLADADPLVALASVAALTNRTLSPGQLLRVDQLLTSGRVHLAVDASLARLLATQPAPANRVPLQTLLARAETGSSDLAIFLRDALAVSQRGEP